MNVPRRKHTYEPPRPVTGIAFYLYIDDDIPHRKHTYGPPRSVTGIALFVYIDDEHTS
jgi:hypothetical protein